MMVSFSFPRHFGSSQTLPDVSITQNTINTTLQTSNYQTCFMFLQTWGTSYNSKVTQVFMFTLGTLFHIAVTMNLKQTFQSKQWHNHYITYFYTINWILVFGSPLLLCSPSVFWLMTALRMPSWWSLTNIMCVAVGMAFVGITTRCLLGRDALCACSSHLPGPVHDVWNPYQSR